MRRCAARPQLLKLRPSSALPGMYTVQCHPAATQRAAGKHRPKQLLTGDALGQVILLEPSCEAHISGVCACDEPCGVRRMQRWAQEYAPGGLLWQSSLGVCGVTAPCKAAQRPASSSLNARAACSAAGVPPVKGCTDTSRRPLSRLKPRATAILWHSLRVQKGGCSAQGSDVGCCPRRGLASLQSCGPLKTC